MTSSRFPNIALGEGAFKEASKISVHPRSSALITLPSLQLSALTSSYIRQGRDTRRGQPE